MIENPTWEKVRLVSVEMRVEGEGWGVVLDED